VNNINWTKVAMHHLKINEPLKLDIWHQGQATPPKAFEKRNRWNELV
jgi:hypothetical protein